MKKRKILLLIPFAGLVLSGCTFQEGWQTATGWLNNNIWTPVKEFFEGLFGGGEKKKEEEEEEDDPKPTPTPTPTPSYPDPEGVEVIGSKEEPISVSEFRTLVDSYIPFDAIDSGKSSTDTDHWYFVEAKVKSSSAFNDYGEVEYLNIYDTEDKSLEVTGHFVLVDESLGDYSAANSLAGKTVVVKGCGCLFNHSTRGKTYQMAKFDNDHKPVVVKVTDPTPSGLDYGTLQNPLTVSQAKVLIDSEDPTLQKAYVTGEVKSNDAYDTGYKNVNRITITDGAAELVIFRCATFPSNVTATEITANSLKGKTVVASGTGELYNGTTYELTSPEIHSCEGEDVPPVVIDDYGTLESPLSISAAKAVIDLQDPTTQDLYVTGEVKSNTAWSTQHNNIDIVLTDGQNDFKLFRAGTIPGGAQPAENALVGKVVVAHGIGTIYSGTYELNSGCVVDSIEEGQAKTISEIVSVVGPSEVALNSTIQPSQVIVTVNYQEGGSGTATVTNLVAPTNVAGEGLTADVTIDGWNETLHFTYNVSSEESNYGSLENPLGVTEARTLIAADGGTSAQSMYVAGTVKSNKAWDSSHSNVDITITDGVNEFIVFRTATFPSGITKEDITLNSLVGQVVVASGTGVIYNETTYEFQQGCVVEFLGSKNIASLVSVEGPSGEYNQGATVLPADVKVIVTFEGGFNGLANVTSVNAPTTTSGTHTGQATVEGLNEPVEFEYTVSAQSSTPVDIVAGENGSACTVNEKDGIKVGTSKLGGSFTITVPAGATSLEVYAAAWNGVSGLSLNITGATTDPSSIALTADSGISNNSPFTLAGSESSFKFTIGLSGITASTTLTFTTSAAKRCVAWSASYR